MLRSAARVLSVLLAPLLGLGLGGAVTSAPLAAQDRPPNVVLILVDDLGWTDLGCQGSTFYETPRIDALAAAGARFTNAYAACAVCSPTRAAILTGHSPARTGVTDWIRARFQRPGRKTPDANPTAYVGGPDRPLLCPPNPFWLELDEVTLAERLRAAGYATCHVGKWHLGDDAWFPEHQGFDENFGGCDYGQPPSYFDPYRNRRLQQGIPTLTPRRKGEYLTDREGDEAAAFVRRSAAKPFFLYYAPYAVHTPIQSRDDDAAPFRDKATTSKQKDANYAGMVRALDRAVGNVLDALDETGVADRTLVILTSDNGGLLGPTDNSPLRSGKGFPYEGGIRVPMLVRWPGVVTPGTVVDRVATSVDVTPTVLEATGVAADDAATFDGRSLAPLLANPTTAASPAPDRAVFWHFPHYRGAVTPYGIVRAGRHKLIEWYEGPYFELYDLEADPSESTNLADRDHARVASMRALLHAHLDLVGAERPRSNPDHAPTPTHRPDGTPLPRVLLLGDSISMAYTPVVRELLRGVAVVRRPMRNARAAENCEGTTKGVDAIDRWLAIDGGDFDVVHVNFGLHDLKRVHPETRRNSNDTSHPRQAEPDAYERQLRAIVDTLRASGAELVLATTTPVPAGGVRPHRDVTDPARYNAIVRAVAGDHAIPVNDLFAVVEPRLQELQRPVDVHFRPAGTRVLAEQVARVVREALARRSTAASGNR